MDTPLLATRSLCVGYGKRPLAGPLGFTLRAGQLTALIGCNGVGKSTLLRTITGELPAISGRVEICGRDLRSIAGRHRAELVAIVTTERLQVGALTVRELVALGRDPHTGFSGRLSGEDRAVADRAMRSVGITHKADSFIAELSDGERQKAMIARALAQETPLIVLDEPFSFLDVAARIEILGMLGRLARDHGKGILFSTHDVAQALRMADRIFMLTPGRQFIEGTPGELTASGAINRLFTTPGITYDPVQHDFISREYGA